MSGIIVFRAEEKAKKIVSYSSRCWGCQGVLQRAIEDSGDDRGQLVSTVFGQKRLTLSKLADFVPLCS